MENTKEVSPSERYAIVKAYLDAHGFSHLSLPRWRAHSSFATTKQKFWLQHEKLQDANFLAALSKEQASLIIDSLLERR
jgi:hypothetical protein